MPYGKCSFFKIFYLIFYKSQLSNSSIKTLDKSILLQIFLQAFVICQFILIFSINLLIQTALDPGFGNVGKVLG